MKKMKALSILLCLALLAGLLAVPAAAFDDVPANAWYAQDVEDVQAYGVMNGRGNNKFDPDGGLTLAEAITMAARVYAYDRQETIETTGASPWYADYVAYAAEKGVYAEDELGAEYAAPCTRLSMAKLFANVVPEEGQEERNEIAALPDVPDTEDNAAVYALYRLGVLTGSDRYGTFNPADGVKRSEACAIINRVLNAEKRRTFTLETADYGDRLITEGVSEAGSYQDPDDYEIEYSYHVPQLVGDSAAVKAMNERIMAGAGAKAKEALELTAKGEYVNATNIKWESHWRDGLVSLVIRIDTMYDWVDYEVYNFDFEADKAVSNAELLRIMDLDEKGYDAAARRSVLQSYDKSYAEMEQTDIFLDMYFSDYGILFARAETLGMLDSLSDALLYQDGDACKLIATVGTIAGSGRAKDIVDLDFTAPACTAKPVSAGGVKAGVKDGHVVISAAESKELTAAPGFQYNREYEVAGLWNGCREMALCTVEGEQYLFLVNNGGCLEFVNVSVGIRAGTFCATPAAGIASVKSLSTDGKAVDGAGKTWELSLWTRAAADKAPWASTWIEQKEMKEAVEFTQEGEFAWYTFGEDDAVSATSRGAIACLGMNDEGTVYGYALEDDEGNALTGALVLQRADYVDEDGEPGGWLNRLKCISGSPLFNQPAGTWVEFIQSYG